MSAVPDFLDALYSAARSSPLLSGWQVVDGPPLEYTRPDVIVLGASTEDLTVEAAKSDAGLGRDRRERSDVTCVARSSTGDAEMSPRRRRAFDGVAAVSALLAQDGTVGDSVTRARVVSAVYTAVRSPQGTAAYVEFGIRLDAFGP